MQSLEKFAFILRNSRKTVFFGGAGLSTESGIPDFRSQDGLYHRKYAIPPEEILSHHYFYEHTEDFYRFYRDKMLPLSALPNKAHAALAEWEHIGLLSSVITQNIDGLHQAAGSKQVLELHGSIHRNYCTCCHAFFDAAYVAQSEGVPHCSWCGGLIKPDVVLYEEPLNQSVLNHSIAEISSADALIVAGTSLSVYPAAGLIRYFHGKELILVNRDATPMDEMATLNIHASVGEIFSKVL